MIFMVSVVFRLSAQNREDQIWVLGYNPNDSINGYGGTKIDFSSDEPTISYFPIAVDADNTAQICDPNGKFQFFTNGCKIINNAGQTIPNSEELNPGYFYETWCNSGGDHSYNIHQGMIALPQPGRSGEYVIFHLAWYVTEWPNRTYLRDMYMTRVDMNANDGLGNVPEKNTLLLQDTNLVDQLTAVRHGNGRDWWVVAPRGKTDSIYLFLLTPYGVKGPYMEPTGLHSELSGFTAGQAVFAPDGTKYARVSRKDGIDIFDFDRCRGKFLYGKRLPFPGTENSGISGAAFSPSSRYLYVSALTKVFQYDLDAQDIELSKTIVGEYDGFRDSTTFALLATAFYQQMLAPNGKIYMSVPNGTVFFHTIHQPDSAGRACDFRQHDLRLATHHGFSVPNFPHFRLFDLPGSPCDTLGIDAPEEYRVFWHPTDGIRLYPNPTGSGASTVTIPPCEGGVLRVYTAAGQHIETQRIVRQRLYMLDCSNWPNGVYVVTFSTADGGRPMVARLVVCR